MSPSPPPPRSSSPSQSTYTTPLLNHPYSPLSPLNTLTVHLPTHTPPPSPLNHPSKTYTLLYIHGGAFRDPCQTSTSIIPSLPTLFSPGSSSHQHHRLAGVISLNYRLAPYPDHPTHPTPKPNSNTSHDENTDTGRNAHWPDPLNDIRSALCYLASQAFENDLANALTSTEGHNSTAVAASVGLKNGREWILGGHSVGGTMAFMLALTPPPRDGSWGSVEGDTEAWGKAMSGLRGLVLLEGIYDFTALRDAHFAQREMYEPWIRELFGPEEEGGWERGSVMAYLRGSNKERKGGLRRGVGKVVVGHSRGDEAVEWGQSEGLVGVLRERLEEREKERVELVEVKGGHDEVVEEGVEIGRCVEFVVQALLRSDKA